MTYINEKTLVGEIVNTYPESTEVLMSKGMHCLGCPASQMETIEQAAAVHGVDADELVKTLNEKLAEVSAE